MTALDDHVATRFADAAVATVAYSSLFDQPIDADDVHRYLHVLARRSEVDDALARAVAAGALAHREGHYALAGCESAFELRARRVASSARLRRRAAPWIERVASIPTVRMVALTGSLAVDNAEPDHDIDLLIVTTDDRLWVTRGLIVAITRLAHGDGIELCPNFLVTESNLELGARDHVAARELLQAIPVFGHEVYRQLLDRNGWYRDFLPNAEPRPSPDRPDRPAPNRLADLLLRSPLGGLVDRLEMRRQFRKLSTADGDPEAQIGPHICKAHYDGHKRRIAEGYAATLAELELGAGR